MKKYFLSMMSILMMTLVSVSFVACGDDDDDNNNYASGSSAKGTSKSDMGDLYIETNYCYWQFSENVEYPAYELEFMSVDVESYLKAGRAFKNADAVHVSIPVNSGDNTSLATGTFKDFELTVLRGVSNRGDNADAIAYISKPDSTGQAQVTISRSGDTYTVDVTGVDIYLDKDGDEPELVKKSASFSYTGKAQNYKALKDEYKDTEQKDDDDEEAEKKDSTNYSSTLTLDDYTFNLEDGYWYKSVDSINNMTYFYINLYNCPYTDLWLNDEYDKLPAEIQEVYVYFKAQSVYFDGLPEGNFVMSSMAGVVVDRDKYLEEIMNPDAQDINSDAYMKTEFIEAGDRAFISIKKEGDKYYLAFSTLEFYKVNIGAMTVLNDPIYVYNWGWAGNLKDINYLYEYNGDEEEEGEGEGESSASRSVKMDTKKLFIKPMFKK